MKSRAWNVVFGVVLAFVVIVSMGAVYEQLDLNEWSIKGVKVTATAADLNATCSGLSGVISSQQVDRTWLGVLTPSQQVDRAWLGVLTASQQVDRTWLGVLTASQQVDRTMASTITSTQQTHAARFAVGTNTTTFTILGLGLTQYQFQVYYGVISNIVVTPP